MSGGRVFFEDILQPLYQSLDNFPDVIVRPLIALGLIVVGYLVSKIIAGLTMVVLSIDKTERDPELPSFQSRLTRVVFWGMWLVFVVIGFFQLPVLASALEQWRMDGTHSLEQGLIVGTTIILLLAGPEKFRVYDKLRKFVQPFIRFRKDNLLTTIVERILSFAILAVSGFALINPNTIALKLMGMFFLVVLGGLLGKIVKELAKNVAGNDILAKVLANLSYGTFIVAAVLLWT